MHKDKSLYLNGKQAPAEYRGLFFLYSKSQLTLRYYLLSPCSSDHHRLLTHPIVPGHYFRSRNDHRTRDRQAAHWIVADLQIISKQGLQVRELRALQHITSKLSEKVALLLWNNRTSDLIPVDELRGLHLFSHQSQRCGFHR